MIQWLRDISFDDPWFLLLLLLVPFFIWWTMSRNKKRTNDMRISSLSAFKDLKNLNWKGWLRNWLWILIPLAFTFLTIAFARPQNRLQEENINTEGIDIVIAMDVSGSMLAMDFKPNRLEAAKELGALFVDERKFDRIGLVVFAGESFTQCPITADHQVVKELFSEMQSGLLEDGTAIGMGLATAVSRLQESLSKSKVVILMTDGVNNSGNIDPITAADIAISYGVKVYTIGVGTEGTAPYPMSSIFGTRTQNIEVNIDEELLTEIAEKTGGLYFRAKDRSELAKIYLEIDKLEKTELEVTTVKRYKEQFHPFAWIGALLLLSFLLLNNTILKSIT